MSLTNYWENFDRTYDDFEKEGLNFENDLLAKTKFGFLGGKFTFSSKSKFDWGSKSKASHEYGLKHKCDKVNAEFKHKDKGETSIEVDAKALKKDDLSVNVFSKISLDQGADRCNTDATVLLRVHHRDNSLISFGFENWQTSSGSPNEATLSTSYGLLKDGANVGFNTYFRFNIKEKFLPLARVLFTAKRGDVQGYLQANINRTQVETDDKINPKVTNQTVDLLGKVIKQVDSKTKVAGAFAYNVDSKLVDASVFGSHVVDRVRFNGRLASDRTLTLGVTSAHDDVTLGFAAKTNLNSVTEKVGDTDHTRHYLTYKFGLSAEFNRV